MKAIAVAMLREVSAAVKASVLDCRCTQPSPVLRTEILYRAHGQYTSSILGGHTRPQLSPDLEALPTSGY
jgi:hypothetical protein